jgi:hypothetical protein
MSRTDISLRVMRFRVYTSGYTAGITDARYRLFIS